MWFRAISHLVLVSSNAAQLPAKVRAAFVFQGFGRRLLSAAKTVDEVRSCKDVGAPEEGDITIAERRSADARQRTARALGFVRSARNDGRRTERGPYSLFVAALALSQAASALAAIAFVAASHLARMRGLTASWFTSQIRHVFGAQSASAAASD
ncbi:MAG TPA: hypothetical protein VIK01_15690 [Polyangiaceae bacterium]